MHLSWSTPSNTAADDVDMYMVHVNAMNLLNETGGANLTITAYSVCNCTTHNISIITINRCGHVGESNNITLDPSPRSLPMVLCEVPKEPPSKQTTTTPSTDCNGFD